MSAKLDFLPYSRQHIDDEDIASVANVLRSDFLTTGPAGISFEKAFAETTQSLNAISCSSGTAALHLATLALELDPGDIVIVPSITFLATANAARYVGADVVFADVDPGTGLMRSRDLTEALDRSRGNVRAVIPVHLCGQSPDMPAIYEIARAHGIAIVEDASHALGTTYKEGNNEVMVGSCSHSDMTIYSFHPVKTIAMGEGGAITTNDKKLEEKLRLLRNHGINRNREAFINYDMAFDNSGEPNAWYYEMHRIGFNYRVSDIHCALGLSQLRKLEKFAKRRQRLAAGYDNILEKFFPLIQPIKRVRGCKPVWHLYTVLIDFEQAKVDRHTLMYRLRNLGIGTQVHYIPIYKQPYYQNLYGDLSLPGSESYYAKCLSLPLFPAMRNEDVERVTDALGSALGVQ